MIAVKRRDEQVVEHIIDTILTYEYDQVFHLNVFEMAWQLPQLRCGGGSRNIHLESSGAGPI